MVFAQDSSSFEIEYTNSQVVFYGGFSELYLPTMSRSGQLGRTEYIAIIKAGSEAYIPRSNPKFLAPRDYRNYLEVSGFLESDEMDLLNRFYGYASQDGSHPGISSEPECRLRRLFTIALVQYLLEKLE